MDIWKSWSAFPGRSGPWPPKTGEYEEKIEAIQKDLAGRTEKFRIGQTAYHREQSRLESLKNITERYDGYGNSIRKVMDHKGQEPAFLA